MGRAQRQFDRNDFRETIARNIKAARMAYEPKMTQAEIAELFSPPLTRAAVAQWEIGETLPDLDRLAVLSKAFGVTIDSLIFGDDESIYSGRSEIGPDALAVARMWQKLDAKMRMAFVAMLRATLEKRKR